MNEIQRQSASSSASESLSAGSLSGTSSKIVVYASLSDEARIRHVSVPYRWYVSFLACAQVIVVIAPHIKEFGDNIIRTQNKFVDSSVLLFGSFSSLVALKRCHPASFVIVSLMNSVAIFLSLYHGYLMESEPWLISCRVLSVVIAISQWYLNDMLRELHSPQTFLMEQNN